MNASQILLASFTAALLAGCGGAQSTGAVPHGALAQIPAHKSSDGALIYVVTDKIVVMFSYPSGKKVGTFSYKSEGDGAICSDPNTGNVFLPVGFNAQSKIYEYAHRAVKPSATLSIPEGYSEPAGCAIDPTTGNLAVVVNFGPSNKGALLIYPYGQGTPAVYSITAPIWWFGYPAYDDSGNLYISVGDTGGGLAIAELPSGQNQLSVFPFANCTCGPRKLQWDGTYLAGFDDNSSGQAVIDQISITGSTATLVNTVPLTKGLLGGEAGFWIYNGSVIANEIRISRNGREYEGIWSYPAGGGPTATFYGYAKGKRDYSQDITVSVKPNT